jgi:hypothetical protein
MGFLRYDLSSSTKRGWQVSKILVAIHPIWQLLTKNNISVGLFGCLHSYPLPEELRNYRFYVPDVFSKGYKCFPDYLNAFQAFNIEMVSKNFRNVGGSIALNSVYNFLLSIGMLGIRPKTIYKIIEQILSEFFDRNKCTRRRTTQMLIAFDIFLNQLKKNEPDASFFFTNHVASSLHRYWPATFPEHYKMLKYDSDWISRWRGEIPHAIKEADSQLGELMLFVDRYPEYKLVILSSMGQEAVQDSTIISNQVLIINPYSLLGFCGLDRNFYEINPSMAPTISLRINSQADGPWVEKLRMIRINGCSVEFKKVGESDFEIYLQVVNVDSLSVDVFGMKIENPSLIGLEVVKIQDSAGSNAYHIPEGILIEYSGKGSNYNIPGKYTKISALDIAPSTLNFFHITPLGYMKKAKIFG